MRDLVWHSGAATPGSLFAALPGRTTHGRHFIPEALARGQAWSWPTRRAPPPWRWRTPGRPSCAWARPSAASSRARSWPWGEARARPPPRRPWPRAWAFPPPGEPQHRPAPCPLLLAPGPPKPRGRGGARRGPPGGDGGALRPGEAPPRRPHRPRGGAPGGLRHPGEGGAGGGPPPPGPHRFGGRAGRPLVLGLREDLLVYGFAEGTFRGRDLELGLRESRFRYGGLHVRVPYPGLGPAYGALAALAAAEVLGLSLEEVAERLARLTLPRGAWRRGRWAAWSSSTTPTTPTPFR